MRGLADKTESAVKIDSEKLFDAFGAAIENAVFKTDFDKDAEGRILAVDAAEVVSDFSSRMKNELYKQTGGIHGGRTLASSFPCEDGLYRKSEQIVDGIVEKFAAAGWQGVHSISSFGDGEKQNTNNTVVRPVDSPEFFFNTSTVKSESATSGLVGTMFSTQPGAKRYALSLLNEISIGRIDKELLEKDIIEILVERLERAGKSEGFATDFRSDIATMKRFGDEFGRLVSLMEEKSVGKIKMHAVANMMRSLYESSRGYGAEMVNGAENFFLEKTKPGKRRSEGNVLRKAIAEDMRIGREICGELAERMANLLKFIEIQSRTPDDSFSLRFPDNRAKFCMHEMDPDSALFQVLPIVPMHSPSIEEAVRPKENVFVFAMRMKKNGNVNNMEDRDKSALYHIKKMVRSAVGLLFPSEEEAGYRDENTLRKLARDFMVFMFCFYNPRKDTKKETLKFSDVVEGMEKICSMLNEPGRTRIREYLGRTTRHPVENLSETELFVIGFILVLLLMVDRKTWDDETARKEAFVKVTKWVHSIRIASSKEEKKTFLNSLLGYMGEQYETSMLNETFSKLGLFVDSIENTAIRELKSYKEVFLSVHEGILSEDVDGYAQGFVFTETGTEDGVSALGKWYRYLVVSDEEPKDSVLCTVKCGIGFRQAYMVPLPSGHEAGGTRKKATKRYDVAATGLLPCFVTSMPIKGITNPGFLFSGNFIVLHNTSKALEEGASMSVLGFNMLAEFLFFAAAKMAKNLENKPATTVFMPLMRIHSKAENNTKGGVLKDVEQLMRLICVQTAQVLNSVSYDENGIESERTGETRPWLSRKRYFLSTTQGYNMNSDNFDVRDWMLNNACAGNDKWKYPNAIKSAFSVLPQRFRFESGGVFDKLNGEAVASLVISSTKSDEERRKGVFSGEKRVAFGRVYLTDVLSPCECRWSLYCSFQSVAGKDELYREPIPEVDDIVWELGIAGVRRMFHISKAPFSEKLNFIGEETERCVFTNKKALRSMRETHFRAIKKTTADVYPEYGDNPENESCGEFILYPCHCLEFPSSVVSSPDVSECSFLCDVTANQTAVLLGNATEGRRNQAFFSITPNPRNPFNEKGQVWEKTSMLMPKRQVKNTYTYIANGESEPGRGLAVSELTSDDKDNEIKRELSSILIVNHLADWAKAGRLSPKKNPYEDIFVPEDSLGDKEQTLEFNVANMIANVNLHLLGFNSCMRMMFSERKKRK